MPVPRILRGPGPLGRPRGAGALVVQRGGDCFLPLRGAKSRGREKHKLLAGRAAPPAGQGSGLSSSFAEARGERAGSCAGPRRPDLGERTGRALDG